MHVHIYASPTLRFYVERKKAIGENTSPRQAQPRRVEDAFIYSWLEKTRMCTYAVEALKELRKLPTAHATANMTLLPFSVPSSANRLEIARGR